MIIGHNGQSITLRMPDDLHCHLRTGKMLHYVSAHTTSQFRRALIMPNTFPNPILTGDDAIRYRNEIVSRLPEGYQGLFEPLMTIQITDKTTKEIVRQARKSGVIAGKAYPVGITTHSENGITDFKKIHPVLEEMQEGGMVLSIHGELPGKFCLDREKLFLEHLCIINHEFPELKIVLEHITTKEARDTILLCKNVAATVTVHHLILTLDDVIGVLLNPHNFCKPIPKRPEDRQALIEAVTNKDPKVFSKFFYGGDNAPHTKENKECAQGCAGIFNAPVALPLLAQIFEAHNALEQLEDFTSISGARFYTLPLNNVQITLIKEDWTVPDHYGDLVPFMAGKTLSWRMI